MHQHLWPPQKTDKLKIGSEDISGVSVDYFRNYPNFFYEMPYPEKPHADSEDTHQMAWMRKLHYLSEYLIKQVFRWSSLFYDDILLHLEMVRNGNMARSQGNAILFRDEYDRRASSESLNESD